ncbi:O-antigen ligase family protein [Blastococcus jejuensis]|uniref:O-antigen ligase family protein n=1 Tax=Blastococcus jejuensis TaxID=351224 RepID=UPI0031DEAAD4
MAGASYAAGRQLMPRLLAVAGIAAATTLVPLIALPFALSSAPLGPPLAYANANAALYVQAAGIAGVAAVLAGSGVWQEATVACSVVLVLTAGAMQSVGGFVTGSAVVAAISASLFRWRLPARSVLAGGIAVVLIGAHVAVLVLGATHRPSVHASSSEAAVTASLSERRLDLWSDAVRLATDHPLIGVGPRRFPAASPTAQLDPDTREAHSATLQMAAEVGWPGAVALLALLVWAATRPLLVGSSRMSTGVGLITATTAAALAVHASVDYLFQFPVLIATAGFILGLGTAAAEAPTRVQPPSHIARPAR